MAEHKTAEAYWNEHLPQIQEYVNTDDDPMAAFKWDQLVWQEMAMYQAIGKEDFQWLVTRRGFNDCQRQFLADAIEAMGLGCAAEIIAAYDAVQLAVASGAKQVTVYSSDPDATVELHRVEVR